MTYIPTEKVESSNIQEIGYHHQTQTLRIIFQEGRAYDYPMVTDAEFKKLMAAESKGRFFNSHIKPMYGHVTVRPDQLQPPPEPCCNHPGKACNDEDCGTCDPSCCPQDRARLGQVVAEGLERGKRLIDGVRPPCKHANTEATSDGTVVGCADCGADLSPTAETVVVHLDTCADPCSIDHTALPVEEREGVIETVCRCCNKAIRIPEEDAVDLCGLCFGGKDGDTDKPCTEHTTS